jgi:hypothetical protein
MKPTVSFKPGDVLVCDRIFYQHYGIYAGNGRVIHYASKDGDFGLDVRVRETSFEQFANGWKCEAVSLSGNSANARRYTPQETIKRARSRLGEGSYNLIFNNCEHFALWCKYGKNKSVQVEKALTAAVVLGAVAIAAHLVKSNEEG